MKPLIQLSLLLFSITGFEQNQNTTMIALTLQDCRNSETYTWYREDTIEFYRQPGNSLAHRLRPKFPTPWPVEIKNVQPGNYTVVYKNWYHQKMEEQITVTEQPVNAVTICSDKLLEYPQHTLAKLKDKDSLSIRFHSEGCFHSDASTLTITKDKDRFVARLYDRHANFVTKKGVATLQFRDGKLLNSVVMSDQQIQDFIRFENELNYAKDGGCTTVDYYEVQSKYLQLKKTDGSCRWNGFYSLKKSLFGEMKL